MKMSTRIRARFIALAIFAAVGTASSAAVGADRTPPQRSDSQRADNSIHDLDLTPAQVEKARTERAAARAARAQRTEADKRALTVSKQGTVASMTKSAPENGVRALDASPAERDALKTQRATAKVQSAERTSAQKKAAAVQKRNDLYEVARSAPGG
jgi:hypothetical protein